jgi:complement component 1 Q subcomponent-binding protein
LAYDPEQEIARGPPKPWTVTDKPGHADVILRRSFGQEDIAVTCVYQPDNFGDEQDPEEINSEDDMDQGAEGSCINMTITINKGADNPTLEISAASYGNEITIDHVYFWEDKDTKETKYDGPNFL